MHIIGNENNILRRNLEDSRDTELRMSHEINRLRTENTKLREALESVLKCAGEIKRDSGCDTCTMYNWPEGSFADGSWCRLRPELRNLGFEVE